MTGTPCKETLIEPLFCNEATLITAGSHLIDRFVPDCEMIALPAKVVEGGTLRWSRGAVTFPETGISGRRRLLGRSKKVTSAAPTDIIFDFRLKDPKNWAHFLNNHLPILFHIAGSEGLEYGNCLLVLPAGIPDYIVSVAGLFGLGVLRTDGRVSGNGIIFDVSPWTAVRPIRAQWVRQSAARSYLEAAQSKTGKADLPRRVFLSRRDTRTLENEAEVAAFLGQRGYVKIYPEDLSVADQFRLFQEAENIVAVHGAGLAPLLYCPAGTVPKKLIELLPCGHMTDVFRVMAQQMGWGWIGVRGKIKPEHVLPAYRLDVPFKKYSLQSFEVDLKSLELAFDLG